MSTPGIVTAALSVALQGSSQSVYRVSVDQTLESARVVATLPGRPPLVRMDSIQAEHLPRGWATHIRDIRAMSGNRPVGVTALPGAEWRLGPQTGDRLTLEYRVDLAFARAPWPAGNEQAGQAFADALYVVGRALFVASDVDGPSVVEFSVPDNWRVSVPWPPLDSASKRFRVPDVATLVRNPMVLGRHPLVRMRRGPFDLELALPGQPPNVSPLAETALQRVLDGYLRLFPRTAASRYLLAFFPSGVDDGEAFLNGAAFTTDDSVTAHGVIVWGNFLAHELMHFWNGQRIRGAGPRATWRWFAEGFTEYYANVTLARQGVVSRGLFLKRAERHIGNYLYFATSPALRRMSIAAAGSNTTANRFGVYDGGWTVALCLDGMIRDATADRRGLDDFMRVVWDRFGPETPGYTTAALDSIANEVAGRDLGGVLQRYVSSEDPLPVTACVARFGLTAQTKGYAAEAFLFPADGGAALRRRLP